jgi:hypothetical protein
MVSTILQLPMIDQRQPQILPPLQGIVIDGTIFNKLASALLL